MHGKTKGISLCSYLYLKLAKIPCSLYYLSWIFLAQSRTRRGWHQWEGRGGRERGKRMNMVQIYDTHVCKCRNDTCLNCSRNQGKGNEREQCSG
jgi:hypothetical protein